MSITFRLMVEAGSHSATFAREPVSGRETVFAPIRDRRPHPTGAGDTFAATCAAHLAAGASLPWALGEAAIAAARAIAVRGLPSPS